MQQNGSKTKNGLKLATLDLDISSHMENGLTDTTRVLIETVYNYVLPFACGFLLATTLNYFMFIGLLLPIVIGIRVK